MKKGKADYIYNQVEKKVDTIDSHTIRAPWIGKMVRVIRVKHARKGELARVQDVLIQQDTPSGLRLLVQYVQYNPANPRAQETLDYDDLVEAEYENSFS